MAWPKFVAMKLAVAVCSIVCLAAFGCSSSNEDTDAALPVPADAGVVEADAEVYADASPDVPAFPDASEVEDAGVAEDAQVEDASTPDATVPLPGFGAISGACGVLDDELTAPEPSTFVNHIDFMTDGYDDADYALLTAGGREIIDDGNAGGSSIMSEVFAFEMLARCEGGLLLKTETEVEYTDPMSKLTDILVELDGMKIGVSVTRAVAFPFDQPYPPERALSLMNDKLGDILLSTANVAPADAWVKQILHVIAYSAQHAEVIEEALMQIDPLVRADTIVIVTVSDGDDAFIY